METSEIAQDRSERLGIAQESLRNVLRRIGGNKLEMLRKTGVVSVRYGQHRADFWSDFSFLFFRRRARPLFPSRRVVALAATLRAASKIIRVIRMIRGSPICRSDYPSTLNSQLSTLNSQLSGPSPSLGDCRLMHRLAVSAPLVQIAPLAVRC